jgi:hypothetical protein
VFEAIAAAFFVAALVWVRRRNQAIDIDARRLKKELADTQRELEKAEHRTQKVLGLLGALQEHKTAPTGKTSWPDLAAFIVQTLGPLAGADIVVLLKWDPEISEYRGAAARGLSPQKLAELRVHSGEGVLGRAATTGSPLSVTGSAAPAPLPPENFLTVPYLVLPLWVHSRVDGLLVLCRPAQGGLGPEAVRLATLMAKQTELTMENLDLYENRRRTHTDLVDAMARAAGIKDAGIAGHTGRTRALVRDMARDMHLPAVLTEQIEFGAMLHDVGKLGVAQTILSKPDTLTDTEYAAVKKHPEIGYELLRGIDFLKAVAPMVLYHHEWVNGQGYPEGLAGEEIPLGARMIGIAHAWDTMITDQPYRKALPANAAVAELRQQAGTQFDPKLVDVFLRVVSKPQANA